MTPPTPKSGAEAVPELEEHDPKFPFYCVIDDTSFVDFTSIATSPENAIEEHLHIDCANIAVYNLCRRAKGDKPDLPMPTWEAKLKEGFKTAEVRLLLASDFDRQSAELAHSQSCLGNLEMAHLELIGERDELDKALLIANLKCNEYGVRMDKAEAELAQAREEFLTCKSACAHNARLAESLSAQLIALRAERGQAEVGETELTSANTPNPKS